ncbi:hypothetical protein [Azospirillum sp. SYSU D00513]|uniref:hypothetical protein n=1 Tax=Azospirillum sp. SYSU D00513 TaxID=2812561 RepID=UPI001A973696|nr:hypothetical protein [Azospirillum sp. SYSU D00513]
MLTFIRNLVGVKTDQAVQGAVEALVQWDPKAATEAELRTMEEHLDRLGRQVAEARTAYNREKKEADAIAGLSRQRLAAAEHLQRQLEGEVDAARKATLEKSLETLVAMLEQMAPEVDREAQDAKDAEEFLQMLEQTYAQAGEKLKTARSELNRAERDMSRAAQQRSVAEQRAEAARQAAGLSSATSGLGMALKAMQDAAAKELEGAEAANAKARLLKPTRPEEEDPNIKAALQAAAGGQPAPSNVVDRLAAIRARQG